MLAKSRVTACTNNPLADTTNSRGARGGARDDPITGGGREPDCARSGESTLDGMGVPSATSCDNSLRLHSTQILFDVLEPVLVPSGTLLCHLPSRFTSHEGNFLSCKLFPELFFKSESTSFLLTLVAMLNRRFLAVVDCDPTPDTKMTQADARGTFTVSSARAPRAPSRRPGRLFYVGGPAPTLPL